MTLKNSSKTIHTIYGTFIITEPVLIELFESKAMQRLKKVHQFGISHYVHKGIDYTRYEHSVGVFALLRRYNQSLPEQISGLLHDVSPCGVDILDVVIFITQIWDTLPLHRHNIIVGSVVLYFFLG